MMPLIDQQIESIDKRHAALNTLNTQLTSAMNLYHDLIKESRLMEQMAALKLGQMAPPSMVVGQYGAPYGTPYVNGTTTVVPPQVHDPSQQPQQAYQQQQQQYVPQGAVPFAHAQFPPGTPGVPPQPQVNGQPVQFQQQQPQPQMGPNVYQR